MGTFNSVLWVGPCSNCSEIVGREVQFRFGETWQHEYSVGERIVWGRADVGEPGLSVVVVEGFALACPNCGEELGECEILVESDRLKGVRELTGRYDFGELGYVELDRPTAEDT